MTELCRISIGLEFFEMLNGFAGPVIYVNERWTKALLVEP